MRSRGMSFRSVKLRLLVGLFVCAAVATPQALRTNPGFFANTLPPGDDQFEIFVFPQGMAVNLFGAFAQGTVVNTDGSLTFLAPLPETNVGSGKAFPFPMAQSEIPIIAPFLADADTRASGSVSFGMDFVNDRQAFAATYLEVGYFNQREFPNNTFQVIIIDRTDTGFGNFDLEFNFASVEWESGEASGGVNGLGGSSARVGWSNGSGQPGTFFELMGSGIPGYLLNNGDGPLIRRSTGSEIPGRHVFAIRPRPSTVLSIVGETTFPDATVGQLYRSALLGVGGSPPYSWDVTGDLPMGLSFVEENQTLTFSLVGTPTQAGTFEFSVLVSDVQNARAERDFTVTVNPGENPFSIITESLPAGQAGSAYFAEIEAAGGFPPYSWELVSTVSLPPGLNLGVGEQCGFSPRTEGPQACLEGTPTEAGEFLIPVQASDAEGSTDLRTYTLLIEDPLMILTESPLPAGEVDMAYLGVIQGSGGTGPWTWEALDPLPPGLRLDPEGACPVDIPGPLSCVAGTPTAEGSFAFRIRLYDARENFVERRFALTINPGQPPPEPLTILTGTDLPDGDVDMAYFALIEGAGGVAPYRWRLEDTLPPGLGFETEGSCGVTSERTLACVRGNPTQAGLFSFTVSLADAEATTVRRTFNLTVNEAPPDPLMILTTTLPGGQVGVPYDAEISGSGGTLPYTWRTEGNVPAGLVLTTANCGPGDTQTACLRGVPGNPGNYEFQVVLSDSGEQSIGRAFTLSIADEPPPDVSLEVPTSVGPAEQEDVQITLADPSSNPINGTLTLSFTPDVVEGPDELDDPDVVFTNNSRTSDFLVEPGETLIDPGVMIQSGTTAGTIRLEVTRLERSGVSILPSPAPFTEISVAPTAPAIADVTLVQTDGGFQACITAFSTPRQITGANFTLTASSTNNLDTTQLSLPEAGALFSEWYQGSESANFGSQFLFTQDFNVDGNLADIASISVVLDNGSGSSQPVSVDLGDFAAACN